MVMTRGHRHDYCIQDVFMRLTFRDEYFQLWPCTSAHKNGRLEEERVTT